MEPTYLEFQYALHSGKKFVVFLFEEDPELYDKLLKYIQGKKGVDCNWSTYHRMAAQGSDEHCPHTLVEVDSNMTWASLTVGDESWQGQLPAAVVSISSAP